MVGTMGYEEDLLYINLAEVYKLNNKNCYRNFRPTFLLNRRTGKSLEMDIYITPLKVGFEYQGAVHFKKTFKHKNDPDASRYRDVLKNNIVFTNRGALAIVEIFEIDLLGDIYNNILKRIINTRNYYANHFKFKKAKYLEYARLAYINKLNVSEWHLATKQNYLYKNNDGFTEKFIEDYKLLEIFSLLITYQRTPEVHKGSQIVQSVKLIKELGFFVINDKIAENIGDILFSVCNVKGELRGV